MSVNCPEIRSLKSDTEVAKALDAEIVDLGLAMMKAIRSWSRIGQIVTVMDREEHWKRLGYNSHGSWLMSVEARTGYCRATLYHFAAKFREIEFHPHVADMVQMTEGTMEVFRQLPEPLQRDADVKEAAKRAPRAAVLRKVISDDYPAAHIEMREKIELSLDASLAALFHQTVEEIRQEEPGATYERVLEILLASRLTK